MRIVIILGYAALAASSCSTASQKDVSGEIIALERRALDRWGKGDPSGYHEVYAPEVTYFDPMQGKRIDGLDGIKAMQAPITGKIHVDRYDMIDPKVQQYGDVAVLPFNLLSYRTGADAKETVVGRWNSTEVYHRIAGTWSIIHVHWSFIKPELKKPVAETGP